MSPFARFFTLMLAGLVLSPAALAYEERGGSDLYILETGDDTYSLGESLGDDDYGRSGHNFGFAGDHVIAESSGADFSLFGQEISIEEDLNGSVRLFGQEIEITGTIGEYAMIFGQDIEIRGDIEGDLFIFAQSAEISGDVGGDVKLFVNDSEITGTIEGNAAIMGLLSFGEDGRIEGDLTLDGMNTGVDEERVGGSISRLAVTTEDTGDLYGFLLIAGIVTGLSWIVAGFFIMMLAKPLRATLEEEKMETGSLLLSLLLGIAVLFLTPMVAVMMMASLFLLPLGILLLLLYFLWLLVGFATGPYVLGRYVLSVGLGKSWYMVLLSGIVGFVLLTLVVMIPFVGIVFGFLVYCVAIGSLLTTQWSLLREDPEEDHEEEAKEEAKSSKN